MRIEQAGGVPDEIVNELRNSARTAAEKQAEEQMNAVTDTAFQSARETGAADASIGDDPARRMAWTLSVTNSMKESAPRERWCRHIRAADPQVTEIRSFAVLSAGIWYCVECLREAGPNALKANLWPNECDLCGAQTETFNELAGRFGGCMINGSVCSDCAGFLNR